MNHHTVDPADPVLASIELAEAATVLHDHTSKPTPESTERLEALVAHLEVRCTEVRGTWAETGYRAWSTLGSCGLEGRRYDPGVYRSACSCLSEAIARCRAATREPVTALS